MTTSRAALLLAIAVAAVTADTGVFWHLTDAHFSAEYKPKTNPLLNCVRGKGNAGKYGAYIECDTPEVTLKGAFSFMAEHQPNPDFVLWTGDISPHYWKEPYDQDWSYGYQNNVSTLIRKHFPKPITVIPVIGNHDPYPQHHIYPGPSEFYDRIADMWKDILPEGAAKTFVNGGFYSTKLSPTLKVIVLNTVLYYNKNSYVNDSKTEDPAGQMAWLRQELASARKAGERVLMAYHIPPGGWPLHLGWIKLNFGFQMYKHLNERFVDAFAGYHDIITAHFAGHTHTDEFRFLKDPSGNGQESVLLIAPAMTEGEYVDPRLRLMQFDRKYPHDVLGYEQYRVSVAESNKNDRLDWFQEYSWTEEYGVPDYTASTLRKLHTQMMSNETLQMQYISKIRGFNIVGTVCEDLAICRTAFLCAMDSAKVAEVNKCNM